MPHNRMRVPCISSVSPSISAARTTIGDLRHGGRLDDLNHARGLTLAATEVLLRGVPISAGAGWSRTASARLAGIGGVMFSMVTTRACSAGPATH
jgi:hypothetical protein